MQSQLKVSSGKKPHYSTICCHIVTIRRSLMSSIQETNAHPRPASPSLESDRPNKRQRRPEETKQQEIKVEEVFTKFEEDLLHAAEGGHLPAVKRLALLICKLQNVDVFSSAAEMAEKCSEQAGFLVYLGNKNTVAPTAAEIAPLYDKFLAAFDRMIVESNRYNKPKTLETLSVHWRVDYGPEGEFADILREWHKEIKEAREKVEGAMLPMGWGVGIKCSYIAQDGCAKHRDNVVDHDGSLLEVDPWEVFYHSEIQADEARAKSLEPTIPQAISHKFCHREIIRHMGYTLEKDAISLAQAGNWGLVNLLIKEAKTISPEAGLAILRQAVTGKELETCQLLLKAGVSLYSPLELLFQMVREWEADDLIKMLDTAKRPEKLPNNYTDIAYHLALRYKEKSWDSREEELFSSIHSGWISAHFPNKKSYEIDGNQKEACSANFCKAFLQIATQHNISIEAQYIHKGAAKSPSAYSYKVQNEQIPCEKPAAHRDDSSTIVTTLGFTFESDAKELAESRNWGLVMQLLEMEQGPLNKKVARKVLWTARYDKQPHICKALFAKGLPIHRKRNNRDDPFFDMVQDWNAKDLKQIVDVAQPHPQNPKRFKDIAFSISLRYGDRNFNAAEQEIFNKLVDIGERAMGSKKAFYEAIVHQIDERRHNFKDKDFENSLRELAKQ